jgi:hydroxyquinol 1,2-dioxygenase
MIVTGQVTDGSKPLAGVSIYVFHADVNGLYTTDGFNSDDRARLHGAMRSDATGHYRFETIRPVGYGVPEPLPAHVHYVVRAPGYKPRMFELWFEDDATVATFRDRLSKLPNVAIRPITRDSDGVWHTTRDLVLARE